MSDTLNGNIKELNDTIVRLKDVLGSPGGAGYPINNTAFRDWPDAITAAREVTSEQQSAINAACLSTSGSSGALLSYLGQQSLAPTVLSVSGTNSTSMRADSVSKCWSSGSTTAPLSGINTLMISGFDTVYRNMSGSTFDEPGSGTPSFKKLVVKDVRECQISSYMCPTMKEIVYDNVSTVSNYLNTSSATTGTATGLTSVLMPDVTSVVNSGSVASCMYLGNSSNVPNLTTLDFGASTYTGAVRYTKASGNSVESKLGKVKVPYGIGTSSSTVESEFYVKNGAVIEYKGLGFEYNSSVGAYVIKDSSPVNIEMPERTLLSSGPFAALGGSSVSSAKFRMLVSDLSSGGSPIIKMNLGGRAYGSIDLEYGNPDKSTCTRALDGGVVMFWVVKRDQYECVGGITQNTVYAGLDILVVLYGGVPSSRIRVYCNNGVLYITY